MGFEMWDSGFVRNGLITCGESPRLVGMSCDGAIFGGLEVRAADGWLMGGWGLSPGQCVRDLLCCCHVVKKKVSGGDGWGSGFPQVHKSRPSSLVTWLLFSVLCLFVPGCLLDQQSSHCRNGSSSSLVRRPLDKGCGEHGDDGWGRAGVIRGGKGVGGK